MMRIVYLHQYFNTREMSGGTRSFEFGRRLVDAGHSVEMVTAWRKKCSTTHWFTTEEAGIRVHWLPVAYSNNMSYGERIKAFLSFACGAARKAASLKSDVIFATSTPLTIALPGVYAARRRKVPMVFEVRDLWPELPIAIGALKNPLMKLVARRLERFAYANAKRIVALSPGMATGISEANYPKEKIAVIPNSSDLDLFRPDKALERCFREEHPELGSRPIVLYAGTIGRINGVSYMVQLAEALENLRPDIAFVVIGSGAEEDKVRRKAAHEGVLGRNFYMYKPLPKKELCKAFAAARVSTSFFIDLPEMESNSANKFFDGLASGTPVAINYGGWQANLLKRHNAGFVLSRNIETAAGQLVDLFRDKAKLKRAGQAARQLAENKFSRDKLAQKLEQVLINAVDS